MRPRAALVGSCRRGSRRAAERRCNEALCRSRSSEMSRRLARNRAAGGAPSSLPTTAGKRSARRSASSADLPLNQTRQPAASSPTPIASPKLASNSLCGRRPPSSGVGTVTRQGGRAVAHDRSIEPARRMRSAALALAWAATATRASSDELMSPESGTACAALTDASSRPAASSNPAAIRATRRGSIVTITPGTYVRCPRSSTLRCGSSE